MKYLSWKKNKQLNRMILCGFIIFLLFIQSACSIRSKIDEPVVIDPIVQEENDLPENQDADSQDLLFSIGAVENCMKQQVPELEEYAQYISEQSAGKASLFIDSDGQLFGVSYEGVQGQYYLVYVGEKWKNHQTNWEWFYVSNDYSKVLWYDATGMISDPSEPQVYSLNEWRYSSAYRDLFDKDNIGIQRKPLIDFDSFADLPAAPPVYKPEIKVVPLTSSYTLYSNVVIGPVAFIDRSFKQPSLPIGARDDLYYILYDWRSGEDSTAFGYVFFIEGNKVFLNVDGTVYPDFYPEPIWGADMSHYSVSNGYLITAVTEFSDYRQSCGVMDLRTMKDVLPPQYDAVTLGTATIWAIRNGEEFLFDYSGNLLKHSTEQVGSYGEKGIEDLMGLYEYEDEYRTLYLPVLTRHSGMIIAQSPGVGISVFTESGTHLLSIQNEALWEYKSEYGYSYKSSDNVVIELANKSVLVVFADGRYKNIDIPESSEDGKIYANSYTYEDNALILHGWQTAYKYDDATKTISVTEHQENNLSFLYETYNDYYQDGYFVVAFLGQQHKVRRIDILNPEGKLLLEGVLGSTIFEPSFPGTLVVWLNETDCVLLNKDGTTTPIPPHTKVEGRYVDWTWHE